MLFVSFKSPYLQELITKALIRSFTRGQISSTPAEASILVTDQANTSDLTGTGYKQIVVFGREPSVSTTPCTPIAVFSTPNTIHYLPHSLTQNLYLKERALERYDFTNEWNNLGYGKILRDSNSPWGIAQDSETFVGLYTPTTGPHILWVNRNAGLIDGFDWRLIEDFIALPVLSEIPDGYTSALTMRIDCDEHIESGRPLYELYKKNGLPFSMAIKTKQEITPGAIALMKEMLQAGGSIVTHSHTHAPNWGGSQQHASDEVNVSREILNAALPNIPIHYAVSPFHQNPPESVQGIANAGINAFVGGIIHNDPEYLMARAGEVPFVEGIISHSEQCMLHGDCYHDAGNSIAVYVDAYKSALATETFFGYLDHPFSSYQYGWKTEEERLSVHQEFLNAIFSTIQDRKKLWFASLSEALDFLWDRAESTLQVRDGKVTVTRESNRSKKKLKIRDSVYKF